MHRTNDCMSSEESVHTQHGNDICIYGASVWLFVAVFVVVFVDQRLLRSFSFGLQYSQLAHYLSISVWHSISVGSFILCLNVSMLYDVCKSVWLELILLGLITSWQIRTPHLLKCSYTLRHTSKKCWHLLLTVCYIATVAVSVFSTL